MSYFLKHYRAGKLSGYPLSDILWFVTFWQLIRKYSGAGYLWLNEDGTTRRETASGILYHLYDSLILNYYHVPSPLTICINSVKGKAPYYFTCTKKHTTYDSTVCLTCGEVK